MMLRLPYWPYFSRISSEFASCASVIAAQAERSSAVTYRAMYGLFSGEPAEALSGVVAEVVSSTSV